LIIVKADIVESGKPNNKDIRLMNRDSLASIMNWSKNLYVFMLGALIVFSGCFGTGTSDGEGDSEQTGEQTGDTVNTTVINYYNNTTVDEPEWFSQGGVVDVEFTQQYNGINDSNLVSSYNFTECFTLGGSPEIVNSPTIFISYMACDIPLTTITTQSGQMLVIHEWTGFNVNTTCDGEGIYQSSSTSITNYGEWRAPGHAMDCIHDIFINNVAPTDFIYANTPSPVLWSVAYSYRAVTVV
jgi:hypothetical protein